MPSVVIHRKKNGLAYAYSVESYWDKEKKAPRNRQVCLGRYNEETGEITPSKRSSRTEKRAASAPDVTASAKVFGPYLLLSKVSKEIGLTSAINRCFPDTHDMILSLAFFVTQKGLPLSRSELWSENHMHPYGQHMSSQRVSDLLKSITEDERQRFLSLWLKRLSEIEYLCYDITSISSYSEGNSYLRYGHNRDKDGLPQVNLAMLFGQSSGLPAYYRRLPGNITDVTTLKQTIETLDFLGKTKLQFILDRGFYSEGNLNALFSKRYRFVIAVPTNRLWVRSILDQYSGCITSPEYYSQVSDDEVLYMASHLHKWQGHRCYLHVFYNATRAAEDYDNLVKSLLIRRTELETGNTKEAYRDLYDRFFVVKNTPKRGLQVSFNEDEIAKYRRRYAGFFCILTNVKMPSAELLGIYRRKDVVENCFDDLKNALDLKRLRVHSSEAMDSRLFIQFISLILLSSVRAIAKTSEALRHSSPRDIMEALEAIVRITYSGRYGCAISEIAPFQKSILETFSLSLET